MGASVSKSRLERRNTVLRRSQKKSLVQTESQLERLFKDIRKFKGVEEDHDFKQLTTRIENYKRELARKSKDLVPQVKMLHTKAQEKISQAEALLDAKLTENREKAEEKKEKKGKKDAKNEKDDEDSGDAEANNNTDEITIEDLEKQREGATSPLSNRSFLSEQSSLVSPSEKRKTVELSFVKVEALDECITPLEKSPQEKRKSILKHGVQVLPTFNNEMSPRQSLASPRNSHNLVKVESKPPNQIIIDTTKEVGLIEEEVSKFEGKKNGLQYNILKERLFNNLDKISEVPDKNDPSYTQLKRYIESCLSFLDEKATDNDEDEVFLPDTPRVVNGYKITSI